jgi:hypothetical protein
MDKLWRLYFHKVDGNGKAWWNVDNGDVNTQIRVGWIGVECASVYSAVAPYAAQGMPTQGVTPNLPRSANEPEAWMQFYGIAEFKDGGVVFRPATATP